MRVGRIYLFKVRSGNITRMLSSRVANPFFCTKKSQKEFFKITFHLTDILLTLQTIDDSSATKTFRFVPILPAVEITTSYCQYFSFPTYPSSIN